MASEPQDGGPCVNTDRHLWPDVSEPGAVHESIHVTAEGGIGMNVGGCVYVKPLREWHRLAGGTEALEARSSKPRYEIQRIPTDGGHTDHRITDTSTDSRVATCYHPDNARLVCDALNAYRAVETSEKPKEWRCYHCDEVFTAQVDAWHHFGGRESAEPACQIKAAGEFALLEALRNAEDQLVRYHSEDSDIIRAMHSMTADHAVALRREEEKGYTRGLRDAEQVKSSVTTNSAPLDISHPSVPASSTGESGGADPFDMEHA